MNQKRVGDKLYVLDFTPYVITEDTDAEVIYVQEEKLAGYAELNPTLVDKLSTINYLVFTVNKQEWAEDKPTPPTGEFDLVIGGQNLTSDEAKVYIEGELQTEGPQHTYHVAEGLSIVIEPLENIEYYHVNELTTTVDLDFDEHGWSFTMPPEDVTVEIDYTAQPAPDPDPSGIIIPAYQIYEDDENSGFDVEVLNPNNLEYTEWLTDAAGNEWSNENVTLENSHITVSNGEHVESLLYHLSFAGNEEYEAFTGQTIISIVPDATERQSQLNAFIDGDLGSDLWLFPEDLAIIDSIEEATGLGANTKQMFTAWEPKVVWHNSNDEYFVLSGDSTTLDDQNDKVYNAPLFYASGPDTLMHWNTSDGTANLGDGIDFVHFYWNGMNVVEMLVDNDAAGNSRTVTYNYNEFTTPFRMKWNAVNSFTVSGTDTFTVRQDQTQVAQDIVTQTVEDDHLVVSANEYKEGYHGWLLLTEKTSNAINAINTEWDNIDGQSEIGNKIQVTATYRFGIGDNDYWETQCSVNDIYASQGNALYMPEGTVVEFNPDSINDNCSIVDITLVVKDTNDDPITSTDNSFEAPDADTYSPLSISFSYNVDKALAPADTETYQQPNFPFMYGPGYLSEIQIQNVQVDDQVPYDEYLNHLAAWTWDETRSVYIKTIEYDHTVLSHELDDTASEYVSIDDTDTLHPVITILGEGSGGYLKVICVDDTDPNDPIYYEAWHPITVELTVPE